MTEMMTAVRLHAFGGPEVLASEEVERPSPGPGEVLIRIESVAVNYADVLRRRNGPYPHPTHLPTTLGIEVAGPIVEIGEGVEEPAIGTPVFVVLPHALGGYAQYAVAPAKSVVPIPPGIDTDTACTLFVSGVTALQILRDVARLEQGETVFVPAAAGGVGTYAVQIAKLMGAGRIIAAAGSPERRERTLQLGATDTVDSTREGWSKQILSLTEGRGADVVLEMIGGDFFDEALASLADFGRMIVFGRVGEQPTGLDPLVLHNRNQTIAGYYVAGQFAGRTAKAVDALKTLIGYVLSGKLDVQIGHVLPLGQASEAHRLIEGRRASGKIILKPWMHT